MKVIANLPGVLREHCASCRLPTALLLSRRNQSPDAVRSRNPSKSTLAHDAVATVVLHKQYSIISVYKHYSIIRVHKHCSIIRAGAGLIQFVYGSHSRLAADLILHRNLFSPFFSRAFSISTVFAEALQSGKGMQADDGEEASPPSSPTASSGSERCTA